MNDTILQILADEHAAAVKKHPEFAKNYKDAICLIAEELGELSQEINDETDRLDQGITKSTWRGCAIREAAHVAVTAIRTMEMLSEADMPAKSEPVNDDKIKIGTWTAGDHCVIEWISLPEPPYYAAQYRRVADVREQADVPKLAAAKDMYDLLEKLPSEIQLLRDSGFFASDAYARIIAHIEPVLKKARGEK